MMHNKCSHKDQVTKYRNFAWRLVLDFPVKPGAKSNQPWVKNRLVLTYGKGWILRRKDFEEVRSVVCLGGTFFEKKTEA